jgi:transposase-like protein
MKKFFAWIMAGVLTLAVGVAWAEQIVASNATPVATPVSKAKKAKVAKKKASKDVWICPMCNTTSDKAGKCPQCGMDMVKEKKAKEKPDQKPITDKSKG